MSNQTRNSVFRLRSVPALYRWCWITNMSIRRDGRRLFRIAIRMPHGSFARPSRAGDFNCRSLPVKIKLAGCSRSQGRKKQGGVEFPLRGGPRRVPIIAYRKKRKRYGKYFEMNECLRRSLARSASLIASITACRICNMPIAVRNGISYRRGGSSGTIGGDLGRDCAA